MNDIRIDKKYAMPTAEPPKMLAFLQENLEKLLNWRKILKNGFVKKRIKMFFPVLLFFY